MAQWTLDFTLFEGLAGQKTEIHAGVAGKVLAAHQDSKLILKEEELKAKTSNTIIGKQEILKEFEKIKNQGYSISNEEHAFGVCTSGCPCYGSEWKSMVLPLSRGKVASYTSADTLNWVHILKEGLKKSPSSSDSENSPFGEESPRHKKFLRRFSKWKS